MSGDRVLAYHCARAITWVKDASQTLLVEDEKGQAWSLQGVEAMIWDLFALGYSFEKTAEFLSVMMNDSRREASKVLAATLHGWEKAGIVRVTGGPERG